MIFTESCSKNSFCVRQKNEGVNLNDFTVCTDLNTWFASVYSVAKIVKTWLCFSVCSQKVGQP